MSKYRRIFRVTNHCVTSQLAKTKRNRVSLQIVFDIGQWLETIESAIKKKICANIVKTIGKQMFIVETSERHTCGTYT